MQRRSRITNIVVLIPGLLLGCCWLPRGISGLLSLTRVVGPGLRAPDIVVDLLRLWSDPIGWYGVQLLGHAREISPRVLGLLMAAPNCWCGLMAASVILLVVFLVLKPGRRTATGSAPSDDNGF